MSISIHELLKKEIGKMIDGIGKAQQGNIYPLLMEEVERSIINLVLERTNYNYLVSSRILGLSRSTLYRKIDNLNIPVEK